MSIRNFSAVSHIGCPLISFSPPIFAFKCSSHKSIWHTSTRVSKMLKATCWSVEINLVSKQLTAFTIWSLVLSSVLSFLITISILLRVLSLKSFFLSVLSLSSLTSVHITFAFACGKINWSYSMLVVGYSSTLIQMAYTPSQTFSISNKFCVNTWFGYDAGE